MHNIVFDQNVKEDNFSNNSKFNKNNYSNEEKISNYNIDIIDDQFKNYNEDV